MSDELINELARAIEHGLAYDVEIDVRASETCIEERRCIAARMLPTIRDYGDKRDADAYQRGKLEGARLAIEAVLPEVVTDRTIDPHGAHCRCTTCELNIAEDAIRALDPAKIVGEGRCDQNPVK